MNNFLDNSEIHVLSSSHFGSAATHTGSPVDMANFDAVIFHAVIGDLGAGGAETYVFKLQGAGTTSATFYDLDGASVGSTGDQNATLTIDCIRPVHRYVRPVLTIGVSTGDAIVMCQIYKPKTGAVSQTTANGVAGSVTIVGPST